MTKNASLIASLESERDTLEDRSKALNKQIEAYRKEISKLEGSAAGSSLIGESTDVRLIAAKADYDLAVNAYNSAQTALTTAELAQKLAKTAYESAKTAYDSAAPDGATDLEAISEQIDELEKTMRRAEEDFELALQKLDDELEALDEAYTKAYRDYKEIKADYESGLFDDVTYEEYRAARDKMEAAEAAYDARKAELQPQIDSMTLTYERELEDNTASLEKLKAKKEKLSGVSGLLQVYKTAEQKLEAEEDELAKTNENFTEAETELAEAKREYESLLSLSSIESHEVSLGELEDQAEDIADRMEVISEEIAELGGDVDAKEQQVIIAALSEELSTLKHNLSRRLAQAGIDAKVEEMELSDMLSKIEKQKDLVKKYEDNSTDAKIVADIAGQVGSLTVVNGSETTMGQTLCEIIVADLGYSCEVTFTTEQSRRVRVGDPVEITNMWWSDVKGTIVSIRNDPKSPGTQKIATISLAGDVVDGQSLQLTIGEKGQTYDAVVPNSAVREDNNGKFVLAIEAKNTPLGNRYVARRYDVEVLASDDVNSAVSGLLGSEFIITTSSKPITSGTQVRPVDN